MNLLKGLTNMKKLLATALIIGASTTLAACADTGTGYIDTQAPYAEERTAGSTQSPVVQERVEVRTEEPVIVREEPVRPAEPVFVERTVK